MFVHENHLYILTYCPLSLLQSQYNYKYFFEGFRLFLSFKTNTNGYISYFEFPIPICFNNEYIKFFLKLKRFTRRFTSEINLKFISSLKRQYLRSFVNCPSGKIPQSLLFSTVSFIFPSVVTTDETA